MGSLTSVFGFPVVLGFAQGLVPIPESELGHARRKLRPHQLLDTRTFSG
jgi:hypothetical protein